MTSRSWTTFLLCAAAWVAPSSARASEERACSAAHVRAQVLKRDMPDKLLERRAALRACSNPQCARSIDNECSAWLQDLDALIPDLTVRVVDSHGNAVPNALIRIDGKVQAAGTPLEVDAGEHTVVAVSDTTESRTVILRTGEKGRSLEIVMASASSAITSPAPAVENQTVPAAPSRTLAYALGGVGVVAIGVGAVTGVMALNAASERDTACGGDFPACADASKRHEMNDLQDRISTAGNISTVAFIGGAVLVAVSCWLYFTSPQAGHAWFKRTPRTDMLGAVQW